MHILLPKITEPIALLEREKSIDLLFLGLLILTTLILLFIRSNNPHFFRQLFQLFFSFGYSKETKKDKIYLNPFLTILLLINFLLGVSMCLYMTLIDLGSGMHAWILPLSLSVGYFLFRILSLAFVSLITGETSLMNRIFMHLLYGFQLFGIIATLIAWFWHFNTPYTPYFKLFFVSFLILLYILRIYKGSLTNLQEGVPWYYIFIYLCTLELLPIGVAYYFFIK